jgi:hypothetical protein
MDVRKGLVDHSLRSKLVRTGYFTKYELATARVRHANGVALTELVSEAKQLTGELRSPADGLGTMCIGHKLGNLGPRHVAYSDIDAEPYGDDLVLLEPRREYASFPGSHDRDGS